MELNHYQRSYMSSLKQGASQPSITDQSALPGILHPLLRTDNRVNYEDVPASTIVSCAVHSFGIKDKDMLEMWQEIITYLKADVMPSCCKDSTE